MDKNKVSATIGFWRMGVPECIISVLVDIPLYEVYREIKIYSILK